MAADPNQDFNFWDCVAVVLKFLSKHFLGIISILFGTVTKVYIIRKEWHRITKWQCRLSVIISGLAGMIAYILVQDMDIKPWQKGITVGFTPIFVEPIITRLLIWVNPIIDAIGNTFKKDIKK